MDISDFDGSYRVATEEELETVLMRRVTWDGACVNSFILAHTVGTVPNELANESPGPTLIILVRDLFAYAWYNPREDHPGFNSIGTMTWIDSQGEIEFSLNGQSTPRPHCDIITFDQALRVAKDFLHSSELPKSIQWDEL